MADNPQGFRLLSAYPAFGRFWAGSVVSAFGDEVGWIALVWLVLRIGGGPVAVGAVTFLYQVPQAIFAPIAGVWMDRLPKAMAMALANAIVGIIFLAIPTLVLLLKHAALAPVLALITMAGCVLPFIATGGTPLVAELVPESHWTQAYFLRQTQWQLAALIGPAVGGVLVAAAGSRILLYVDGVTFFVVAGVLLSLAPFKTPRNRAPRQPLRQDLQEGIRLLFRLRPVLALGVISFFFYFLYGPYNVVLPVLAKLHYGGPAAFGYLWTAFAVATLGGSLLFAGRSWRYRVSWTLAAIIAVWGVVTFVLAIAPSLWAALSLMGTGGFIYGPWMGLVVTLRQKLVPPDMQARMTGINQAITAGGEPLGALLAGLFLHVAGVAATLIATGAATILLGCLALLWPTFRQLDKIGLDD